MADYRVTVRPLVTQIRIVAGAPVVSGDGGGGSGDVVGPSSATNNAIARFDGTTGKLLQSSDATIDDGGGLFCDTLTTTGGAAIGSALEVDGDITVSGTVAGVDLPTLADDVANHLANTSNPHSTDWTQLGTITRADLAGLVTGGVGDVVGPASATDRAIAVYNLTTGKLIAGSGVIVDASDNVTDITSLVLDGLTAMPTPPASGVRVYGRMRAGRTWLDAMGPSGRDYPVQPALAFNGGGFWRPSSGSTINVLGLPITNTGTVAHGTLAAGSLRSSSSRWRMATATAAASGLGNRTNAHCCWRGDAAGLGGFTLVFRFCLQAVSANSAFFGGLLAATGALAGTAVPSAQVSCIGIGYNIGQTTLRILHNDASGACTTIDLGASFPTNVPDAFYTVVFHCAANASSVFYRVVREDTGASADGELTTDLPAATAFLAPQLHMNNNNLAETIAYECFGLALDKDY